MSGRLNTVSTAITSPAARLSNPGLAIVYLGTSGNYLTFTEPADARALAAACTRAAELLEGPQVVEA